MDITPWEVVDGVIPAAVLRHVRQTGLASIGSWDKSLITLDGLLPVAEHLRELIIIYGPCDLSLLPAFPGLTNLSVGSSPRKVDLSGLVNLEGLSLTCTPTMRRAVAAAELPSLRALGLSGASADFAAHNYSIRPTSVSFLHARKLERLDSSLGWLGEVEELDIHGSSRFSLASLRGMPALRRLELHAVTRVRDVAEVGQALEQVDVELESCREVDDVQAFLNLQARSIRVAGENLPITRAEAASIPIEDHGPLGRWSLPPILDSAPPLASVFRAEGFDPAYAERIVSGQLSEAERDRLEARLAAAWGEVLARRGVELRPPYAIENQALIAVSAFSDYGSFDSAADTMEYALVIGHRLDRDPDRWQELRATFAVALNDDQ